MIDKENWTEEHGAQPAVISNCFHIVLSPWTTSSVDGGAKPKSIKFVASRTIQFYSTTNFEHLGKILSKATIEIKITASRLCSCLVWKNIIFPTFRPLC